VRVCFRGARRGAFLIGSVLSAFIPNPRQAGVLAVVRERGTVSVEALAEQFGVTLQTVRRDVKLLSDAGLLARFHGGVRTAASTTENIANPSACQAPIIIMTNRHVVARGMTPPMKRAASASAIMSAQGSRSSARGNRSSRRGVSSWRTSSDEV